MKNFLLLLTLNFFIVTVSAQQLVLIPLKNATEAKHFFSEKNLQVHFYNDRFLIATSNTKSKLGEIILDITPWGGGVGYYIVYFDDFNVKYNYLKEFGGIFENLFDGEDFLIVSTNEQKYGQLIPAKNDGLVRIFPYAASFTELSSFSFPYVTQANSEIQELLSQVSGVNITSSVSNLEGYGTRNAYSSESVQAQQWIASAFEEMGLEVEEMDFQMPSGEASDNVIAIHRGVEKPDEYIVVGGHYDSYSRSGPAPGADDNASGTAAVMEIARILSQKKFPRSIIFCAFSGEEYGLYGSAAYAKRSRDENLNILGYFNLDMIGYLKPGNSMLTTLIYPQTAKPLADYYSNICSVYLPGFIVQSGALSGGDSDHTSFNNNGYMGIFPFENITAYSPYIHTSNDIVGPSYNNQQQAVVFTKAALASVATLAMDLNTSVSTQFSVVNIYPNPANRKITVNLISVERVKLDVINTVGDLIFTQIIDQDNITLSTDWPKGVYLFRFTSTSINQVQKVVIQ
jgi:hypothetical protein